MYDKLELRDPDNLKSTRLVQRLEKGHGKAVDNPFSFGGGLRNGGLTPEAMAALRPILAFDYMGAAEFEFGAVPEAFRFLAEQGEQKNLEGGIVVVQNHPIYFICPKPYAEEVANRIQLIYQQKINLKEPAHLSRYFENMKYGPSHFSQRICGWIELDNGFMFFADKRMWLQCCDLFGLTAE